MQPLRRDLLLASVVLALGVCIPGCSKEQDTSANAGGSKQAPGVISGGSGDSPRGNFIGDAFVAVTRPVLLAQVGQPYRMCLAEGKPPHDLADLGLGNGLLPRSPRGTKKA